MFQQSETLSAQIIAEFTRFVSSASLPQLTAVSPFLSQLIPLLQQPHLLYAFGDSLSALVSELSRRMEG